MNRLLKQWEELTKCKEKLIQKREPAGRPDPGERAFQELKDALCSGPGLVIPDFSKPLVVQTDASETGVGAVLAQLQEGPVPRMDRGRHVRERRLGGMGCPSLPV